MKLEGEDNWNRSLASSFKHEIHQFLWWREKMLKRNTLGWIVEASAEQGFQLQAAGERTVNTSFLLVCKHNVIDRPEAYNRSSSVMDYQHKRDELNVLRVPRASQVQVFGDGTFINTVDNACTYSRHWGKREAGGCHCQTNVSDASVIQLSVSWKTIYCFLALQNQCLCPSPPVVYRTAYHSKYRLGLREKKKCL